MYKRWFILILAVFVICLSGCVSKNEKTSLAENTMETTGTENVEANEGQATQTVNVVENYKETPIPIVDSGNSNAPCTNIDKDIAKEYISGSYFTINDIMSSMGLSEEDINKKFEDTVSYSFIGRGDNAYEELYNDEFGLYFIVQMNQGVQYIEIEAEEISLLGLNKKSNFDDVKEILGDTDVITTVHDLLGLERYEMVYEYNGHFLRIYSFDELGESGLYFCFTDDYETKYGFYSINTDEINRFFNMTMEEIQTELGVGTKPFEYRLKFEDYGASFDFNEEGSELQGMDLIGMYQIEGLRDYMSIDKTQSIMGKGEVIEKMTSEDGMLTILRYEFDDFVLEVNYLLGIDRFPWWNIVRKE